MIPSTFDSCCWLVLVAVSVCIHVRLRRMRVRGRGHWLAGVLLYGLAWTSGSSTNYLPVYAVFGTGVRIYSYAEDLTPDSSRAGTSGNVLGAQTRQMLAALGYLSTTSAPTPSAGTHGSSTTTREATSAALASAGSPPAEPIRPLVILLMTAVHALLVLAALGCMWIGLTRISRHARFVVEASIVRCPDCKHTFQPPPDLYGQCPRCGLKIRVKRIVSARRIGIPSASTL
jgi:DNA-directed RNA polymerase subunit RPC12/RpoP